MWIFQLAMFDRMVYSVYSRHMRMVRNIINPARVEG